MVKITKIHLSICLSTTALIMACQAPNLNSNAVSEAKDKLASGLPVSSSVSPTSTSSSGIGEPVKTNNSSQQNSAPIAQPIASPTNSNLVSQDKVTSKENAFLTTIAGLMPGVNPSTNDMRDGKSGESRFKNPTALTVDSQGNIFVIDDGSRIRKISPDGVVSTIGTSPGANISLTKRDKDGTYADAVFNDAVGLTVDNNNNVYTITSRYRIRKISPEGIVSTLFDGYPVTSSTDFSNAGTLLWHQGTNFWFSGKITNGSNTYEGITKLEIISGKLQIKQIAKVDALRNHTCGLGLDSKGNFYLPCGTQIWKVSSDGNVSLYAGKEDLTSGPSLPPGKLVDGQINDATFGYSSLITLDKQDNLYLSEVSRDREFIRKISTKDGLVSTITEGHNGNQDGSATTASISTVPGLYFDPISYSLYFSQAHRIRKITFK